MKRALKISILYTLKFLGIFYLCRYFTKNGLRFLCYHNFSEEDAVRFLPQTFIRPDTFKKRIEYLKRKKYPIIGIDEGIRLLSRNNIPSCGTVITIDDGWFGIMSHAHKVLADQQFPYTIYVTSYYAEKEIPIFELVIRYIFWKTIHKNWHRAILDLVPEVMISSISSSNKGDILDEIINFGEKNLDNEGRKLLMKKIAEALGVDYAELLQKRTFSLLNHREIHELSKSGVSIQLHTHRHVWPLNLENAKQEIARNKAFLEPLVENSLEHFCYPNGSWNEKQLPFFDELDIKSATTCDPGLNFGYTNMFALRRYVDGENRCQIEFEAEMSGCAYLLRNIMNRLSIVKKY